MIERVAVVVPAADEEDSIGACLDALEVARLEVLRGNPEVRTVDLVVVLDGCRDRTPSVVEDRARAGHVHAVRTSFRRVGAARRAGADRAVAALGRPDRLWLASTDADSVAPPHWITCMVDAADAGSRLVLGTVLPGPGLTSELREAWFAGHDLTDGHPHVHGANLGIRADAYRALGGWRDDLTCHEDVHLVRAAEAAGLPILRTASIPVVTSARFDGRAPNGFAQYLRTLEHSVGSSVAVAS